MKYKYRLYVCIYKYIEKTYHMNFVNVPRVCWGLKFDTQTEGLGVYLIDSYRLIDSWDF